MNPPMRSIPFCKAHGLGNDFLIIEESALEMRDIGSLAQGICARHSGVGADGVVVLGRSDSCDATFRIFNQDGSEAGLSGNAVRCAGTYLLDRRARLGEVAAEGQRVALETRVGVRDLFFQRRAERAWIFRTEIGVPSFAAADVPFTPPGAPPEPVVGYPLPVGDKAVYVTVLSMGNPQCILFTDDFEALDWRGLGARLERHPYFPDRANIGFVRVVEEGAIEARFWERGAGHTLASGTGSCACAVASHLAGNCGRRVKVLLERGAMDVNWRDDGMVELTGPAVLVSEGIFYL